MANINGGLMANQNNNTAVQNKPQNNVKNILANVNYKKRFEEILGKKAPGFISSIINISNSPTLKDCEPMSVVSAAVVAATLDLPIDPNLGQSYIVPYNDKNKGKIAQFQIGYKGFIQLAMRSGQYKTINAVEVYEGELKHVNRLTGEIEFEDTPEPSNKIIGYVAYFRLLNGFEKAFYMTKEQIEAHGKKYSQSYKSKKDFVVKSSLWTTDFDTMAIKTVLKLLLSKYGVLSIEMQKAIEADQAFIKDDVVTKGAEFDSSKAEYIDVPTDGAIDVEYQENNNSSIDDVSQSEQQDMFEGTPFEES